MTSAVTTKLLLFTFTHYTVLFINGRSKLIPENKGIHAV